MPQQGVGGRKPGIHPHFLFPSGNAEKMSSLFLLLSTVKPTRLLVLKTIDSHGVLVYIHSNPRRCSRQHCFQCSMKQQGHKQPLSLNNKNVFKHFYMYACKYVEKGSVGCTLIKRGYLSKEDRKVGVSSFSTYI